MGPTSPGGENVPSGQWGAGGPLQREMLMACSVRATWTFLPPPPTGGTTHECEGLDGWVGVWMGGWVDVMDGCEGLFNPVAWGAVRQRGEYSPGKFGAA